MGINTTMQAALQVQNSAESESAFDNANLCLGKCPPVLSLTSDGDSNSPDNNSPLLKPGFIAELTAAVKEDLQSEQKNESVPQKEQQSEEGEAEWMTGIDDEMLLSFLNDPKFTSLLEEEPGAFEELFEVSGSEEQNDLESEDLESESESLYEPMEEEFENEESDTTDLETVQQTKKPVAQLVNKKSKKAGKNKKKKTHPKVKSVKMKSQYFSYTYRKNLKMRKNMQHFHMGPVNKTYGSATYMNAVLGPKAPMIGTGCSPRVKPFWYKTIKRPKIKAFFSAKMVQAHLMNDKLGGTGKSMKNLATFTKSANSYHEKLVESTLKTGIKNGNFIEYEVNIDYSTHPKAKTIGGKAFYKTLNSKDKKELKRLCLLMPGKMTCNSTVIDKNGKIVPGKDLSTTIYNEDSSIK